MNRDQDDDERERPSKSRRKREHRAVQQLAEELAAMPESRLRRLELGARTREELGIARGMKPSGARNRQLRLIAKLISEDEDVDALRQGPEDLHREQRAAGARHHAAERLRERLLAEGESALEGLCLETPERERLRELLHAVHAPTGGVTATTARRELYRLALALLQREE